MFNTLISLMDMPFHRSWNRGKKRTQLVLNHRANEEVKVYLKTDRLNKLLPCTV
jgi:hypothetical protein